MKVIVPYFESERSFANFHVKDSKIWVIFNEENQLIATSVHGNYYVARFDTENGGECKVEEVKKLIQH